MSLGLKKRPMPASISATSEQQESSFSDSSTVHASSPKHSTNDDNDALAASNTTYVAQPSFSELSKKHDSVHQDAKSSALLSRGPWFVDGHGRVTMLRGVNLSGANKTPSGPHFPRYSHEPRAFYDKQDREVSFVGRPFPLLEADEHFQRLKSWGFTFFRLCIAWEALEHAGPGLYDEAYISYVIKLLKKAKVYGFKCFIDPHQDVWSRHTGGSGAPGWTLHIAGLDPKQFTATGAAVVHNTYSDVDAFPKMIWPTNYYKLGCATMFTLFFGGRDFAPKCLVHPSGIDGHKRDKVNVQDFLQDHFINSFVHLATSIREAGGLIDDVVIGYDSLNEPSGGYIGSENLNLHMSTQELKKGLTPTPFEGMRLGEGHATRVQVWDVTCVGPRKGGSSLENEGGARAWLDNTTCIWAQHGVWDRQTGELLCSDYFARSPVTGEHVEFARDYWRPFVRKFTAALRSVHPAAIMFVEPPVNEEPPEWIPEEGDPSTALCFAPHWYDGLTLINKHFNWYTVDYLGVKRGKYPTYVHALWLGEKGIKRCFSDQMTLIKEESNRLIGDFPVLIGEIGIPYDLDGRHAYETGDYRQQVRAMDANISALETNLLNFTLWNYCPDNSHRWGDKWNGEDLSIYSPLIDPAKRAGHMTTKRQHNSYHVDATQIESAELTTFNDVANSPQCDTPNVEDPSQSLLRAGDEQNSALIGPVPQDLDAGGRALQAILRPYPIYTPGTPVRLTFSIRSRIFNYVFISITQGEDDIDQSGKPREFDAASNTCEIYLPRYHYPDAESFNVQVSDGTWTYSEENQRILWMQDEKGRHEILIKPRLPGSVNHRRGDAKHDAEENATWFNSCSACIIL